MKKAESNMFPKKSALIGTFLKGGKTLFVGQRPYSNYTNVWNLEQILQGHKEKLLIRCILVFVAPCIRRTTNHHSLSAINAYPVFSSLVSHTPSQLLKHAGNVARTP